jgi:hypothetical protein
MPIHGYPGNVITANPVAPTSTVATGVWTTEQQLKAVAAGNWPLYVPPYQISRSLRFNSADSAYLNRTPASASNRRTFTLSGWVKRTSPGSLLEVFSGYTGLGNGDLRTIARFTAGNLLSISSTQMQVAGDWAVETTQVFRDPSAWYHIVIAVDTTQATSTNRVKMYVNGAEITSFSYAVYPSLNYQNAINYNFVHYIGLGYDSANPNTFTNGYITEFNFIDGQALTPSSFGETNTSTGVWQAKAYSGSYGTNGFYLNFSDNSNTTAATLGKDYSGNGNNWTPNNFSVTAGVGNDSLVDSPASYSPGDTGVGGEVRGNYCTLNPLNKQSNLTLANGNLDTSSPAVGTWRSVVGTVAMTSGKWYWEATAGANGAANHYFVGIAAISFNALTDNVFLGSTADTWSYYGANGAKYNNNSGVGYGATYTTNDVIGIAYDADSGTLTFYKNGVSQGTAFTGLTGAMVAGTTGYNGSGMYHNFGQRPFAYTAPSGFSCLVTTNLPTPTIGATSTTQANDYMNVVLYTGNGSTLSVTGVGFQPDFVWLKSRGAARSHRWWDVLRGVTKGLSSDLTNAEYTESGLTAFDSDGFTLGSQSGSNTNAEAFVAWNWKANGAGSSNTAGTITSTVSANTTSGFSIVTYTGTSANATVGHGLGVAPSMVIVKTRSNVDGWFVYNKEIGNTKYLRLNTTDAAATFNLWQNTSPTSTVFSISTDATVNQSGYTYVAYCFAPVAGYSAFGSYTGNGSSDGPFVFTNFRPRYLMIKGSSFSGGNWLIWDTVRATYNAASPVLFANLSNAEDTAPDVDILSNGFKLRTATNRNTNGETYIYAAFAESPFKYALAR